MQQMFAQLLNNRNNDETTGRNHDEEENPDAEPPKTEKSKGSSIIDADIIKGIQSQIASLTQRDELKKVAMSVLTCWNQIQFSIRESSSHLRYTSMMARACQTSASITSDRKLVIS